MFRSIIGIVLLAVSSQVLAAEKIRIGWVYAMANAPVVIADKKGYFKEAGVDVEITSFTSGPILQQALAAGQLDMAYIGAPPVYHWYSRGLKSQILAKVNYGQAAIIARSDSNIKSLADLKGKKLAGVKKGSGNDVLLRGYILGAEGKLDADKDLQVIDMPSGNMGASLQAGVVDAAFVWEPFKTQELLRGNAKIVYDADDKLGKAVWYVVMALPETIEKKSDGLQRALSAHKKAVDFLNSSPTAGNDIIADAFNISPIDGPAGKKYSPTDVVAAARKNLGWEWKLTDADQAFIQQLMGYSLALGFIPGEMKTTQLVDTRYQAKLVKMEAGN